MTRGLDLADIQGNIVRPYGRFGFPFARYFFFNIGTAAAGRFFVEQLRHKVTTAERWGTIDGYADPDVPSRPKVAINIGFTFWGLVALALPVRTLSGLPEEFIDGMAERASILGDIEASAPSRWDPIWQNARTETGKQIHVWVSLNAQMNPDGTAVDELQQETAWLKGLAVGSEGIALLTGHQGPNTEYQDSSAILSKMEDGTVVPTPKEHFGFTDSISDPTFAHQYEQAVEAEEVIGGGKLLPDDKGWAPLAAGEFILGHVSEAQELPPTTPPWSFTRNGTFMVYRKLHQNVASFHDYVDQQAAVFEKVEGLQSREAARETLFAKMVGRWRSGIPLAAAPTYDEAMVLAAKWVDIPAIQVKEAARRTGAEKARLTAYNRLLTDFRYKDDVIGVKCPVSAHIRRVNPRDTLDPTFGSPGSAPSSALTNRRRILRRGLPYGNSTVPDDSSEHGVIFMAICGSLFRQFEFIQQQWVNYGASFNVGNDTDPLIGLRRAGAKFVVPADPNQDKTPFICANIPQFVETRGGDYFFLPSLTALREIAQGSIDPT